MGVYIKGLKMPKSCLECKLDLRTDICKAFCEWNAEHPYSIRGRDRLPDCPLVEVPEPHGRLIDADALEKYLSNAEIEATRQRKYVFASALNTICGNIRNLPTIEPEREKGEWIADMRGEK